MYGIGSHRGPLLILVAVLALVTAVGSAYAMTALTGIPDDQGVFHACVNNDSGAIKLVSREGACTDNSSKIFWNRTGPKGETGAAGAQGEPGPEGPAGPSDAFSVEQANEIAIPTGPPTAVLTLADVPARKYGVIANIVVDNLNSPETIPVNCYLGSPSEFSPPYSARIDPFSSAGAGAHTASGASVQTIALTFTTQFAAPGDIKLLCQSNTGTGNMADGSRRQITAIKVTNLRENDLAP